jgi:CheY-like chemotaxis protein
MSTSDENPLCIYPPLSILFVDDDPLITSIVVDHYTELGFRVSTACNGEEALRMLEQELADIILCDRRMPVMSGADLIEAIRERGPEWQKPVFVFVTALRDRRDRYAMMPSHPDGFIFKPLDFARDDLRLAEILKKRSALPPSP